MERLLRFAAIVDKDRGGNSVDVEVMVAGDGEVPHPTRCLLGSVAPGDGGDGTTGAAQAIAAVESGGFDPAAGGGVQNRWLAVVWMTDVRGPALTFRS
jgi:hypothetical protein